MKTHVVIVYHNLHFLKKNPELLVPERNVTINTEFVMLSLNR
jgi:hypothetical protein